ncbi:MAG: DpnD/PcfM family protein [Lachnospiraceae bacterium]|nr:DpnD/PcfM family protein [Lachnospiraceae bacterium]
MKKDYKEFCVDTPVGQIKVEAKDEGGSYPGIWVSLTDGSEEDIVLNMTEFSPRDGKIVTNIYEDIDLDDPTQKIGFDFTSRKEKPEQKPFKVEVTEVYRRNIVIWAENKDEAYERAEELSNSGEIDLDGRDFEGRECNIDREISRAEVEDFQYVYNGEGKTCW